MVENLPEIHPHLPLRSALYIAGVFDSGCTFGIRIARSRGMIKYIPTLELNRPIEVLQYLQKILGGYIGRGVSGRTFRLRLKSDQVYQALEAVGGCMLTRKRERGLIIALRSTKDDQQRELLRGLIKRSRVETPASYATEFSTCSPTPEAQ